MDMKEEIGKLLADYDESYGSFQMGRLVVGRAGGTIYGMYKQALRELNGRREALKEAYIERLEINNDINEAEHEEADTSNSVYQRERWSFRRKRAYLRRDSMERKVERILKEINRLVTMAMELKKQVGPLDPGRRDELETELHKYLIRRQAMLEVRLTGRPSIGSMESLFAMEPYERASLNMELLRKTDVVRFFDKGGFEPPDATMQIPDEEIKRLIT